jgi:hypothetical protein
MASKHDHEQKQEINPGNPPAPETSLQELAIAANAAALMLSRLGGIHADQDQIRTAVTTAANLIRECKRQLDERPPAVDDKPVTAA